MRLNRRFATLFLALALASASAGVAGSAEARRRPPRAHDVQLQVLSFNDFHGHLQPPGGADATLGTTLDPTNTPVGGAEYLASTLENLRSSARHSHTVAAGDLIGGSPFLSGLFHDEPAVETVEKGLKATKAAGVPVDLDGAAQKPPASALAVVRTGFGPEAVPASWAAVRARRT